jgi:hypothetical protein
LWAELRLKSLEVLHRPGNLLKHAGEVRLDLDPDGFDLAAGG